MLTGQCGARAPWLSGSAIELGGQRRVERLAPRRYYLPAGGGERDDAAGGEVQVAPVAALTGDQYFLYSRYPIPALDLVDLNVHSRKELLARQKRLDVKRPKEVPGRASGHPLRESRSAKDAAQRVHEERQAEALVRCVRASQRGKQAALEELFWVGGRAPGLIEDDPVRHRRALLRREANLLHRGDSRRHVQDHGWVAVRGEAVGEGVSPEDGRPPARWCEQRNEVCTREADEAGLGRQPRVGPGDQELPVPDRGNSHTLALAGMLDTPPHPARGRARPAPAVSVEEDRAVCLVQHPDPRARIELPVAVEVGQNAHRGDAVIAVAAEFG